MEDSAKISARMEINMGKTVFMFPGQGAQYIGMAKDFYDAIPECREVFEEASEASGLDIAALCFEENDKINITEYTQICMLTAEAAILRALEVKGYKADVTAGLSLGEYGALIACGALSRKDAFALVRKRGIYMQEAVPEGGAMAAVLALDTAQIEEACKKTEGIVSIANYNCPGQIVITGEEKAVAAAGELCKEAGAKRVVPLKVSGPFHSPLLYGAGEQLQKELGKITFNKIQIPYIANLTAEYVTDSKEIPELLRKQVYSPVRFEQTLRKLITDGFDTFIEIGPGRTLTGFVKKTAKEMQCEGITCINIEKEEDLSQLITE